MGKYTLKIITFIIKSNQLVFMVTKMLNFNYIFKRKSSCSAKKTFNERVFYAVVKIYS